MNPAVSLMSRLRTLASGRAPAVASESMAVTPQAPPADDDVADAGPLLATGLNLDAWIDHEGPDGDIAERHLVIRNLHGRHAPDGCPEPFAVRARCEETGRMRLVAVDRIRGLRARRHGPCMTRDEDIAMWLRVESGLLHQRDIERLTGLRRRAQDEADAVDQPGRDRRWVEPTPVRIETTRDDAPLARRIEDMLLLSWDPGPDGRPAVIYVAKEADARRGRAVRIGSGGDAPNRLMMLQAPPGNLAIADVPRWVAGLPPRRTVLAAAQ